MIFRISFWTAAFKSKAAIEDYKIATNLVLLLAKSKSRLTFLLDSFLIF
jgi:hypothetical protein